MNIQDIHIKEKDFKIIIISDSHTNLSNIRKLKELYPDSQFISLGDLTFLHAKDGEQYNSHSIQYFIDNKIPALFGNHEQHILACYQADAGENLYSWHVIPRFDEHSSLVGQYNLSKEHINFLRKLPTGIKLILSNGQYYLLYHNLPRDLWGFKEKLTEKEFKEIYAIDEKFLGVISGHLHMNIVQEYPSIKAKRYVVGQLCGSNHHTGENNGKNYLILTEKGLEYKKV